MTRSTLKSWILACLIVVFATSFAAGAEVITVINKDQLKAELTKPDVIVIDVRAPHDWDSSQWKIQGARRLSPAEAGQSMSSFPKDKTLVFYCA